MICWMLDNIKSSLGDRLHPRYFTPAVIWAGVILIATGIPGDYIPEKLDFWKWIGPDKVVHLLMFGIFQVLILQGFRRTKSSVSFGIYLISFGIGIVFGIITEVLQIHVFIGRSGNLYDMLANGIGSLLGILASHIFFLARNKTDKKIRNLAP